MSGTVGEAARFSLGGRLVTGASRGIGAAITAGLDEAGADVVLTSRSLPELTRLAAAIRAGGHAAVAVACDVTDRDSVKTCVDQMVAEMGGVDVLVNNAGGPFFHAPVLAIREDGWHHALDLDLTSVLRLSQIVAPGRGSIINIASVLPTRSGRRSPPTAPRRPL